MIPEIYTFGKRSTVPPYYQEKEVRYIVKLTLDGMFAGLTAIKKAKKGQEKKLVAIPFAKRTWVKPQLIADNALYVFGVPGDKTEEEAQVYHQAYCDLLKECAEDTADPMVQAVLTFIGNDEQKSKAISRIDTKTPTSDYIIFAIQGEYPTDLPHIQHYWKQRMEGGDSGQRDIKGREGVCSLCGTYTFIPNVHPSKVFKTTLMSAEKTAFQSYNMPSSVGIGVCLDCGETAAKGMKMLLEDSRHHYSIAGNQFVWWRQDGQDDACIPELIEPRDLLKTVFEKHQPTQRGVAFYATFLSYESGNQARFSFVNTLTSTVDEVYEQLARWFRQHCIVYQGEPQYFGLYRLIAATKPRGAKIDSEDTKKIEWLFQAALYGKPIPLTMLQQVLSRIRAESKVSPAQAALIRIILVRHLGLETEAMMELDTTNQRVAYRLGRLFALLVGLYRKTHKENRSLALQDYGAASTRPATIFPRLIKRAQHHIVTLEQRGQATQWIKTLMGEITQGMTTYPKILTVTEQGEFSLGFLNQQEHDIAQGKAHGIEEEDGVEQLSLIAEGDNDNE